MTDDRCRDVIVQHWTTINGVPLERRIQVIFRSSYSVAACSAGQVPCNANYYIIIFKMSGLADGGGGVVCGCAAVDGLVLCVNLLHALEAALDSFYLAVSPVYCPL